MVLGHNITNEVHLLLLQHYLLPLDSVASGICEKYGVLLNKILLSRMVVVVRYLVLHFKVLEISGFQFGCNRSHNGSNVY
jgi:hypothetical protein